MQVVILRRGNKSTGARMQKKAGGENFILHFHCAAFMAAGALSLLDWLVCVSNSGCGLAARRGVLPSGGTSNDTAQTVCGCAGRQLAASTLGELRVSLSCRAR